MVERKAFPIKPNRQCQLSQRGETCLRCLIMKKKRLIRASMFVMIDDTTLIPKNGARKSFSYQVKLSMSAIPIG